MPLLIFLKYFLNLIFIFNVISFSNALNWLTYAGIVKKSAIYYERKKEDIVWFSNTYFITFIFLSYLVKKKKNFLLFHIRDHG